VEKHVLLRRDDLMHFASVVGCAYGALAEVVDSGLFSRTDTEVFNQVADDLLRMGQDFMARAGMISEQGHRFQWSGDEEVAGG